VREWKRKPLLRNGPCNCLEAHYDWRRGLIPLRPSPPSILRPQRHGPAPAPSPTPSREGVQDEKILQRKATLAREPAPTCDAPRTLHVRDASAVFPPEPQCRPAAGLAKSIPKMLLTPTLSRAWRPGVPNCWRVPAARPRVCLAQRLVSTCRQLVGPTSASLPVVGIDRTRTPAQAWTWRQGHRDFHRRAPFG